MQSGLSLLNKSDLRMFRIKFEDKTHIVLSNIDISNGYKIEVPIFKLNPTTKGILFNLLLNSY